MIIDADDFCETNNRLDLLFQLKAKIPNFKINLFTIINKCSKEFIDEVKKLDWIDMIPHGWEHQDSYECSKWTYEEAKDYLDKIEIYHLTKGFKAPGWQISDGVYKALSEKGYWVADQHYNDERRPKELNVAYPEYHYHIQNVCGNGLEESFDEILQLKGDFKFIKELYENTSRPQQHRE